MRIGILASSGGSAFAAFHDILVRALPESFTFIAATDRICGFEAVCEKRKIPYTRVNGNDNETISNNAEAFFVSQGGVDIVLLYFLRLVEPVIYNKYPTFNIHPSLLPAFSGFQPVKRAFKSGVKFFGATLHQVDDSIDNGPIVAQIAMPIAPYDTLEKLEKLSYLHKVYLALLLIDMLVCGAARIEDGRFIAAKDYSYNDSCCPCLTKGPLLEGFESLQRQNCENLFS